MKWICLQPRPWVFPAPSPAPLLDGDEMARWTRAASNAQLRVVAAMIDAQLRRYGFRFAVAGGRIYGAAEARVVADVVGLGLDLWEISAQIEEAKWETGEP